MSISYWFAQKLGLLAILIYLGAGAALIFSYYNSGVAAPEALAAYYPAGQSYQRTTKNHIMRQILGLPSSDDEAKSASQTIAIIAYNEDGAVVRMDNTQEEVTTNKVIKNLVNKDSDEWEAMFEPLQRPFLALLEMHLKFMKGVEKNVGGDDPTGLRNLILPKLVISAVYLGFVFIVYFILKRMDRMSQYQGGYSLLYGALIFWPISVIAISIIGANVLDMIRHLPDSWHFMRPAVVGSWAVIFAWPLLWIAIGLVDVVRSFARMEINHALTHAFVLAAAVVAIPLTAIGALFAVAACAIYAGYRTVKRVAFSGKRR